MGSERSACGESDTLTPFSLLSGCGWGTLNTLIRYIAVVVVVVVVVDINKHQVAKTEDVEVENLTL